MATIEKRHRFKRIDERSGTPFPPSLTEDGVPDRVAMKKALREVVTDLREQRVTYVKRRAPGGRTYFMAVKTISETEDVVYRYGRAFRVDHSKLDATGQATVTEIVDKLATPVWLTGNPEQDRALGLILAWELHKAIDDDVQGERRMLDILSEMSPDEVEALGLRQAIDEIEAELAADADEEAREYREEFLPELRRIMEEAAKRFAKTTKAAQRAMRRQRGEPEEEVVVYGPSHPKGRFAPGEELYRPRGPREDTPVWATGGAAPATSPEEDMPDDKLRQRSGAGFPTADGKRPAWNRNRGKK